MIKLILSIIIVLFFLFRETACYYFFPEMKTVTGQWDCSNELTMNVYASIIFISTALPFLQTKYLITDYFALLILVFCVCDVLDRACKIYYFTFIDKVFTIPFCIIISAIFYALRKQQSRQQS